MPTRRLGPTILQLNGPALEELVELFSSPYDMHHPNHPATVNFAPAEEYIKTIGHITRAYLDPEAWVRELSFDLIISSVTFECLNPTVLDEIVAVAGAQDAARQARPSYPFNYHDMRADDDPNYDPNGLTIVAREQLFDLIETDAHGEQGRRIFDLHKPSIDASFGRFFARVEPQLRVIEVRYALIPYGFGYDRALQAYRNLRSPEELGPVRDRGLVGLLRHVAGRADGINRPSAFTPLSPLPAVGNPLIEFPEIRVPTTAPRWVNPPEQSSPPPSVPTAPATSPTAVPADPFAENVPTAEDPAATPLEATPAAETRLEPAPAEPASETPGLDEERYVPTDEWLADLGTPSHAEADLFRHLAVLEQGGVCLLLDAPWDGRQRPLLVVAPDWTNVMVLEPLVGSSHRWVASDWVSGDRGAVLAALSAGRPVTVAELRDGAAHA